MQGLAVPVPKDLGEPEQPGREGSEVAAEALEREPPADGPGVEADDADAEQPFSGRLAAAEHGESGEVERAPPEPDAEIVECGREPAHDAAAFPITLEPFTQAAVLLDERLLALARFAGRWRHAQAAQHLRDIDGDRVAALDIDGGDVGLRISGLVAVPEVQDAADAQHEHEGDEAGDDADRHGCALREAAASAESGE